MSGNETDVQALLITAVSFILLAALTVACESKTPTSPTTQSGPDQKLSAQVGGRVIDYTTSAAVAGATLEWRPINDQLQPTKRVTTDSAGAYGVSLELLPMYSLSVSVPGASSSTSGRVVIPALQHRTDFYVNHGGCVVMYGYVFDATTRRPIVGASVMWARVSVNPAVTTGDGAYRIEAGCGRQSYGIGTTGIQVSQSGYASVTRLSTRAEFLSIGAIFREDFELTPSP